MTAKQLARPPMTGDQSTIDVRNDGERLIGSVERLERLVEWFDVKLPAAPDPQQ